MVQLAPAVKLAPQLLVWLNSVAIPLRLILKIVKVAVPVLLKVTVWAALDVFTRWLPKAKAAGDTLAPGATPVPESVMGFSATLLLLVSERVPFRAPVADGVNVTAIVQPAPGASVLPQLLV